MSHTIKPTSAAYKNQEYLARLIRNLKAKNNEIQKSPQKEDTSSGAGTPLSSDKSEMSGSGSNSSDSWALQSRIADLKELQQNKGDFTRPDGTLGVTPEKSLLEQFFGNDSFFGDTWETKDY